MNNLTLLSLKQTIKENTEMKETIKRVLRNGDNLMDWQREALSKHVSGE